MSYAVPDQPAAGCACSGLGQQQNAVDSTVVASPILFGALVVTLTVIGWGMTRMDDQPRRNRRRRMAR